MSQADKTYVQFEPGGLITAEAMNQMQSKICADIAAQIAAALAALTEVANAGDSGKLGGETSDDLLNRFLEKAMQEFPSHTGYRRYFKVLPNDTVKMIKHGLEMYPLVDIYSLLSFPVVCAEDDFKHVQNVRMFLYHSGEKKIRDPNDDKSMITIEDVSGNIPVSKIPLASMLSVLGVEYNDKTSLQDLEAELWDKMFEDPSDQFDPVQYCHSPWYERCCREERQVGSIKEKGDWDELWIKILPVKRLCDCPAPAARDTDTGNDQSGGATDESGGRVEVGHLDFNTLALRYVEAASLSPGQTPAGGTAAQDDDARHVMVLMKV